MYYEASKSAIISVSSDNDENMDFDDKNIEEDHTSNTSDNQFEEDEEFDAFTDENDDARIKEDAKPPSVKMDPT